MKAIVAVDRNWGIGKNGGLLTHLPGDLKYFKQQTIGKAIVVGRKTLESFPGGKPLPGRINIVITRNVDYEAEGCIVCHSMEEIMKQIQQYAPEDVFIAGGAEVYRQFMDLCEDFYVTKIDASFEADRYFPDLDAMGCEPVWESPVQQEKGITYRFLKYRKGR